MDTASLVVYVTVPVTRPRRAACASESTAHATEARPVCTPGPWGLLWFTRPKLAQDHESHKAASANSRVSSNLSLLLFNYY
jgi:hypothetical protein